MLLGYLATGERFGQKAFLTDSQLSPRSQLLRHCGRSHCDKVYVDGKDGAPKHIGYIIAGEWWTIYEVHEWTGKQGA